VDYSHVIRCDYSFGRQFWLHSVIHCEYWKSIIHVMYTIDFQYSWITERNACLGVNIAWGSIPFRGWHRLKVSRLEVKTAWRSNPFGGSPFGDFSTLFGNPKLKMIPKSLEFWESFLGAFFVRDQWKIRKDSSSKSRELFSNWEYTC